MWSPRKFLAISEGVVFSNWGFSPLFIPIVLPEATPIFSGRVRRSDMDERSANPTPPNPYRRLWPRSDWHVHDIRPRPFVSASAGLCLAKNINFGECQG